MATSSSLTTLSRSGCNFGCSYWFVRASLLYDFRLALPFQRPAWRASSFPLRVDPSRFSDGPSCRFFLGRYRRNALFTRHSVAEATPMDLQDSGPFSPTEAVFLQCRRRTAKGDV